MAIEYKELDLTMICVCKDNCIMDSGPFWTGDSSDLCRHSRPHGRTEHCHPGYVSCGVCKKIGEPDPARLFPDVPKKVERKVDKTDKSLRDNGGIEVKINSMPERLDAICEQLTMEL